MRFVYAAGLCLILSGCELPAFDLGGKSGRNAITVTQDAIRVTGPDGYCIDEDSLSMSVTEAFVVFGNCAAIAGNERASQPATRAIATVSVTQQTDRSAAIATGANELASFFDTEEGRQTLSRTGTASEVETLSSAVEDGTVFLHVTDSGDGAAQGVSDTYWRSYFDVKTSVVSVSVLTFNSLPVDDADALELLRDFTRSIKGTSSATQTAAPQTPVDLIRRLFN